MDLREIFVATNGVIGGEVAVVEVLASVKALILVFGELSSGITGSRGLCGHVIDYGVGYDINPMLAAGSNHVGKLLTSSEP